jgi:hypothetical protein
MAFTFWLSRYRPTDGRKVPQTADLLTSENDVLRRTVIRSKQVQIGRVHRHLS